MTTIVTTTPEITSILRRIVEDEPYNTIRSFVADEALRYADNPAQMFIDLSRGGCQSGTIGSLIYYTDTHAFFDTYYDEIEELREDYEYETGEPLPIKGDLKNWLAWFAFEEVSYRVADELGM